MSASFRRYLVVLTLVGVNLSCVIAGTEITLAPSTSTPTEPSPTPTFTLTATRPTNTPTPIPPTATETYTSTPTATLLPTSTITFTPELPGIRFPETPVPVPLPYAYPEGQTRILLLGVDSRNMDSQRVDAILLLSLNTLQGTASLLSIPPTLYVNIPDIGMERLGSAIFFGGSGNVIDTIQYNLGIRPDRYVTVDLKNLTLILESLQPFNVQVGSQLINRCDLPQSVEGWCAVNPGLTSMDAGMLIWYVRNTAGGETERMRRSQEALLAVFQTLMEMRAPSRIDELFSAYQSNVETDLTVDDLVMLSPAAFNLFSTRQIKSFVLSTGEAAPATLPGGQNVLLLDQKAAWNLILRAVFTP